MLPAAAPAASRGCETALRTSVARKTILDQLGRTPRGAEEDAIISSMQHRQKVTSLALQAPRGKNPRGYGVGRTHTVLGAKLEVAASTSIHLRPNALRPPKKTLTSGMAPPSPQTKRTLKNNVLLLIPTQSKTTNRRLLRNAPSSKEHRS